MISVDQSPNFFSFPTVSARSLRDYRIRTFTIGAFIAVLPLMVNVFWRFFDSSSTPTVIFKSVIGDLAFAGVAISITTFSNTKESFVKLDGFKNTGIWTFILLFINTVSAIICFISYMRATHAPPSDDQILVLFSFSASFAIGTLVTGVIAQFTFVRDEVRQARAEARRIPEIEDEI